MSFSHDEIAIHLDAGVATVSPTGELDLATAPALRSALERAVSMGPQRIRVSLRAVSFIDSTGLAALVHGWRVASDQGVGFTVAEPAPHVRRVMEITHLERLFDGPET